MTQGLNTKQIARIGQQQDSQRLHKLIVECHQINVSLWHFHLSISDSTSFLPWTQSTLSNKPLAPEYQNNSQPDRKPSMYVQYFLAKLISLINDFAK